VAIANSIGIVLAALVILIALGWLLFEAKFRSRPGNLLEITAGEWDLAIYEPDHYRLVGELELINHTQRFEVMVPELKADATLLSKGSLDTISTHLRVIPCHLDAAAREDGYWFAYIVKRQPTRLQIVLEIRGEDLAALQSAWVRIRCMTYGPEGRIPKIRHVIVPLQFPAVEDSQRWRPTAIADVLPVRTHLLTHLDNPVEVVRRYVMPHAQPGDVVTIGETPLALMQGRFRHPSDVHPGWLAKRLCYFFLPTSSLATACGLQTLVDVVGAWQVAYAFAVGAIAKKFLNRPGVFYQLAGEQARLIDDVTGTLPPYDQFIVLGPHNPQQVVEQIQKETGLAAAIVDANDLKAVKILAATSGLSEKFLEQALISNPAGNADEQTPVVLIRPTN
jgi:hypothetical protein